MLKVEKFASAPNLQIYSEWLGYHTLRNSFLRESSIGFKLIHSSQNDSPQTMFKKG
jgi:hypothetical protein